jgi:predicted PurR-regulated permease PerM
MRGTNPMNEMLDTFVASYGVVVTVLIAVLVSIFAISTILLPLFVWGIHNQTKRATRELIKLHETVERLRLKPAPLEEIVKLPLKDNRIEDKLEKEAHKTVPPEPLTWDPRPDMKPQAFKPRKVFIKPDEEVQDRRKQAG